jgi:protein-S-isoprenylcysteine O-methyltransferase Ste14
VLRIVIRAIVYATIFVSVVFVYLPSQALARAGVTLPEHAGALQVAGAAVTAIGAALALWCVVTLVWFGRGTPAPFDPPRRLVMRGPYRRVRNPMYLSAILALGGAALFYGTWALLAYAAAFAAAMHLLVVFYEEPWLAATFGDEYLAYRERAGRWWPRG